MFHPRGDRGRGRGDRGRGRGDRGRGRAAGGDFAADIHRQSDLQAHSPHQEIPHPPQSSYRHDIYPPDSNTSSNRETRRQPSNDSLSQKEKILESIRSRRREDISYGEEDLALVKEDGQLGTIGKIIEIYHEEMGKLDLCINSNLFGIRSLSEASQSFHHKLVNIHKTLNNHHNDCIKARNNIEKKSRYTALTATLSTYYRYIRNAKKSITYELSTLAPRGFQESPPKISSNDIKDNIKTFVIMNLEEILNNKNIKVTTKYNILYEIGKSNEKKVSPDLVRILSNKRINRKVRAKIADTIGILGDPTVSPDLIRILSNTPNGWADEQEVGESIAKAIKNLRDPTVLPDLTNLRNKHFYRAVYNQIIDTHNYLSYLQGQQPQQPHHPDRTNTDYRSL
jgi:hypothetical protein